eukprot:jgi/Bigna1/42360/e_gw1.63.16.1
MASAAANASPGVTKYTHLGVIGKGTFGKVSKIRRKSDREILAWKELYYGNMTEKEKQQLVAEVNILRELSHPNIVKYYDRVIDRTQKKIYVVMEYCAGGDLGSYIKEKRAKRKWVSERLIWRILSETASALRHCHLRDSGDKILHRDLKPGNIFLDEELHVKLGDFGLATVLNSSTSYAKTHVGTPYYMSPEQVTEANYNEKSDIWSLGCLAYELASLTPPFRAKNHLALAVKIQQGKYARIPRHYSVDLDDIIRQMLRVDSKARPRIDELIAIVKKLLEKKEKELSAREAAVRLREADLLRKFDYSPKIKTRRGGGRTVLGKLDANLRPLVFKFPSL